jgi:hypothetical protein
MKRIVIVAGIATILLGAAGSAAAKPMEAGVILGEPTGLVIKLWQNKSNAIDVAAAWSPGGEAIHIHADYLIHKYDMLKMSGKKLPVYFGLGAKAVLLSDLHAGLRIPLGVVFPLGDSPLKVGLEVVPTVDVLPSTGVGFNGALLITFTF